MSATSQGSASFTVVIVGLIALVVGGFMLTFVMYPLYNTFVGSALWNAETVAGTRLLTYTAGMWEFWAGFLLLGLTSYIWVETRQ